MGTKPNGLRGTQDGSASGAGKCGARSSRCTAATPTTSKHSKTNGGPTTQPPRHYPPSPHGEPNSTTADKTHAKSSPSNTSSPTTPNNYANKAAASPRHGNPAPHHQSGHPHPTHSPVGSMTLHSDICVKPSVTPRRSGSKKHKIIGVPVGYYTGLQMGELRALRWRNVGFANSVLHDRSSDQRQRRVEHESGRMVMLLVDQAVAARDRVGRHLDFTSPDDLVFCNADGRALDESALRRRYKRAPALASPRPAPPSARNSPRVASPS